MIDERTRQRIEASLGQGDIAAAAALAEDALAAGQDDPMLLNLAAWRREEARDYDGARALLDRALAGAPDDPTIIAAIGTVLRKQGRYAEALKMLDRAIALAPGYAVPWMERGFTLDAASSLHEAAKSFSRAIALDPQAGPAHSGAATVAVRLADFDAARGHATQALTLNPDDVAAIRAMAAVELDAGEAPAAVARLRKLLARSDLDAEDRISAQTLLGDALNRQNLTDEAFEAWGAAKSQFATLYAPHFTSDESHIDKVRRLTAEIEGLPTSAEPLAPAPGEASQHGFVLGFPRSGNTLAENVLASAPGVSTLEEAPTLADAESYLQEPGGLARLAAADSATLGALRAAYWRRVAALGPDVAGKAFVDSDPLKSVSLSLIARLFPEARVMVLLRDPRDIVLSCYRINFVANAATYEYRSLEGIARHYDAVMRLLTTAIDRLSINARLIRYADLVRDFDAVTQGMCDFLGVQWTPAMRDFNRTARARDVSTASVAQVRRGLFDGTGQWRKYERQLAPVLPILTPWIERFGMADG